MHRKRSESRPSAPVHFEVGDRVRSEAFGEGEVIAVEKAGVNKILSVRFPSSTAKFVEGSAKLEKV